MVDNEEEGHDAEAGETPASNTWIEVGIDIVACEPICTVYEDDPGDDNHHHQKDKNIHMVVRVITLNDRKSDRNRNE
uniref:Uncharacterized protein n=1 Tax=Natrinema halophilum TaxID=1699371 RepID=A0A7D5KQK6_9EURY